MRTVTMNVKPTPELQQKIDAMLDDARAAVDRAIRPDDEQTDAAMKSLEDSLPGFANGYNEAYTRNAVRQALADARQTILDAHADERRDKMEALP